MHVCREMYFSTPMVTDQEKSDCCSIDVSCIISLEILLRHHNNTDDEDGNFSKIFFARIVNGSLVYEEGKDDHFVFEGAYENV